MIPLPLNRQNNKCSTRLKHTIYLLMVLCSAMVAQAQQPVADTAAKKQLLIQHADRIGFRNVDSLNQFQLLAGKVAVHQDKTLFYCDSAAINTVTNVLESFGHVHINDADSLHIYSDYLKYLGKEKKATLTGNVKLTDGKGTLTTKQLDYDLNTKIGSYMQGGKVVNGKTVLTSKEGFYYEDTRDVYFKKNVVLDDPEYNIKTDTLLYNTYTGLATFIVPTVIVSDSGNRKITTRDGYYNTKTKKAYFGKRPEIQDGSTFLIADEVANDDSTGFGEARGNVIYRDTAQDVTILANHLNSNSKTGAFLASEKPVMIIKQDDDSIFVAADTLYSAKLSSLRKYRTVPDVLHTQEQAPAAVFADSGLLSSDSLLADSINVPGTRDSIQRLITRNSVDTLSAAKPVNDSADRFFEAYYHVRIFSDSLQAVCDSLFYSLEDSVFRLFRQPIVWSRDNQVTGDTIYLFTENKKPKRAYVFENALSVEKVGDQYYNQVKGRTINGYFVDGNIDYLRARGNSESIFYAQDDYKKFIGVNRATADVIDMYFDKKKPERVVFRSSLVGTMLPMRQVNHNDLRLRGFKWLDELRPRTKYALFAD